MSTNYSNLVVFDFCETIVNRQTANAFVNFIATQRPTKLSKFVSWLEVNLTKLRFFAVVDLFMPSLNLSKKVNLFKIRGIDASELELLSVQFYNSFIKNNFNKTILEKLNSYVISTENLVIVISGGYEPYLSLFCKEFGIHYLLSSKINQKNGKLTGFLKGKDCMFEEKVNQVEDYLFQKAISIDNKIVYSDSVSDLPLFKWADKCYVISYNKPQSWPTKYSYDEIIINRNVQ